MEPVTYSVNQKTISKYLTIGLFFIIILPLFAISCDDQRIQTITWVEYEPVYMSHEEFVNSVSLKEARDLERPGKIFFYDGHLFVNEINKGVHIIDNQDPSNPVNIGFINIPANKDIAVRGNRLYADSNKELLVFDITNLQQADLIKRVEDVFNQSANMAPGFTTQRVDESEGVVVDWREVVKKEVCESNCRSHPAHGAQIDIAFDSPNRTGVASEFSGGGSGGSGVGGSMARFAITGNYLYAVDYRDLITFEITTSDALKTDHQHVGWMIETIFPYNNNLFIGSANAMYIYDLENPAAPNRLSVFQHATACDPVVVEGNYAYVTLRDGENCPNITGANQLEVIDVSDLTNPKNIGIYEMIKPHGLGIDNGDLFISEGEYGLKILDANDPYNVKLLEHIKSIRTFDVIPLNGVLMVTGESGILQYDYSDIHNLELLSIIPVNKN